MGVSPVRGKKLSELLQTLICQLQSVCISISTICSQLLFLRQMSGIWYPTAVATAAVATAGSVLFNLSGSLSGNAHISHSATKHLSSEIPENAATSPLTPLTSGASPQARFDRAMELAHQAVEAYQSAQSATGEARMDFILREHFLWQGSLEQLAAIPPGDRLYTQASEKAAHYRQLLATAEKKIAVSDRIKPDCIYTSLDGEIDPLRDRMCH